MLNQIIPILNNFIPTPDLFFNLYNLLKENFRNKLFLIINNIVEHARET